MKFLRHFLNSFKELVVLKDCGNEFHSSEAECEKERSNSADRDLGINKRPFSDDFNENESVSDIGFYKFEIYAGVKLFNALLYINRFGIDSQPNCSNM